MSDTIQDEYTVQSMKRQQKWNLRKPDKLADRYKQSEKGKAANKRYYEKKKAAQFSTIQTIDNSEA
jgi:hypothetical protein